MGIDGIGSSIVIALAAVLWFVYLVPTWLRRREYLATERNAVRLQQTMRIMAESAELPAVVRVEATARSVATQEKALRKEQQRRSAIPLPERRPEALEGGSRSDRLEGTPRSNARLRRSRALATLVLLASLAAAGFGVSALVATGSWVLLAASVVVAAGAFALLGQAAAVSRARAELRRTVTSEPAASELHDYAEFDQPRQQSGWTPVPLPKPLYLSRPAPAALAEEVAARSSRRETAEVLDPVASLRAAAAEAERALREAQASPEVARISRPAAASRFASMGIVAEQDAVKTDLDAILSRRRAVG